MLNGETSIDHISVLPDSILQDILSLLTVEDFIKTSVLSKRWRSVWANVPVLCFSEKSHKYTSYFLRFVSQILTNYAGKHLNKFSITIAYESSFSWVLDLWIRLVTELKVKNLNLSMYPKNKNSIYQLPQSIYSNSSLISLGMYACKLNPVSVSWTSLRVLVICYAKLDNNALAIILQGSPNLEYLKLMSFDLVDKIIVTHSNIKLKFLGLQNWEKLTSTLEISAPHIYYLSLVGSLRRAKWINLSSIQNLFFHDVGSEIMIRVLGGLQGLQFRLSCRSLEVLPRPQMPAFPLMKSNCEAYVVDSCVKEWDFHRIVTLVQATPNLKHLAIVMDNSSLYEFSDKTEYWESMKADVRCHHLRRLVICGFEKSWCIGSRLKFFTSMVKLLLTTALVLEKIIICAGSYKNTVEHKTYELADLSEVEKLISCHPRVSLAILRNPPFDHPTLEVPIRSYKFDIF